MYSLFYALNNQHSEEFVPVRCNGQTVSRLVRYFEDVVTENNLSALVIQGRCFSGEPLWESERTARLAAASRHLYLYACDRSCPDRTWAPGSRSNLTVLEEPGYHQLETGPFILVMDARFCGLLASYIVNLDESNVKPMYEMIWTFDPNLVFTAVEYLMARISVQRPEERSQFEAMVNSSTPHSSSIRIALTFTTKLAMLMQRQNELEMAINTISSAISSTLELDIMLQSAVEEVGQALNARRAALVLWDGQTNNAESMSIYERNAENHLWRAKQRDVQFSGNRTALNLSLPGLTVAGNSRDSVRHATSSPEGHSNRSDETGVLGASADIASAAAQLKGQPRVDNAARTASPPGGTGERVDPPLTPGPLRVPVTYRSSEIGVLVVEDDTLGRNWESEELLMVKTVSDQLAVAISHARLFRQVQTEAITDSLTGLYNLRHLNDCIEREIKLADRNKHALSIILLDLDRLKPINDSLGHLAGDACLRHVADVMRKTVRDTDTCARYGGEEFVIVLPQCPRENALNVAEKLREEIARNPVERVGQVTASIGVASYPGAARSREELVEMADRAMYLAKAAGRNRVRTLMHRPSAFTASEHEQP
jgi:diguanylate cyclase (GGDEF)-like protein